jgi:hypothetical protein
MKQDAITDLRRSMSTLGVSEAELAWRKIAGKGLTHLHQLTEAMRTEVRSFREPRIPVNAAFSPEEWNRLYKEIDQAAARDLSSSVDRAISELESQRKEIDTEIIRQQAELDRNYREFDNIKERAEKLHLSLGGFKAARSEFASAEAEYSRLYEHFCKGNAVHRDAFLGLAETIVTRDLKLAVIEKLEAQAKAAIVALQKRNKELAKELNLEPHSI